MSRPRQRTPYDTAKALRYTALVTVDDDPDTPWKASPYEVTQDEMRALDIEFVPGRAVDADIYASRLAELLQADRYKRVSRVILSRQEQTNVARAGDCLALVSKTYETFAALGRRAVLLSVPGFCAETWMTPRIDDILEHIPRGCVLRLPTHSRSSTYCRGGKVLDLGHPSPRGAAHDEVVASEYDRLTYLSYLGRV